MALRPSARGQSQQSGRHGAATVPPRVARLAGGRVRAKGLVDQVIASPALAKGISAFVVRTGTTNSINRLDVLEVLIAAAGSTETQVALLNMFHGLASDAQVRAILVSLGRPYAEVAGFSYASQRIQRTAVNFELLTWMKERNLISSFSETALGDDYRVNTFRRDPSGT